jgi:hypothetical protein
LRRSARRPPRALSTGRAGSCRMRPATAGSSRPTGQATSPTGAITTAGRAPTGSMRRPPS